VSFPFSRTRSSDLYRIALSPKLSLGNVVVLVQVASARTCCSSGSMVDRETLKPVGSQIPTGWVLHDAPDRVMVWSNLIAEWHPLALGHHRRKVPFIICAMPLRHSYDSIYVSYRPCASLAVDIALMHIQIPHWQLLIWLSGTRSKGVMHPPMRHLAAFGTSFREKHTRSATACQQ
jgi:hypothetical protein